VEFDETSEFDPGVEGLFKNLSKPKLIILIGLLIVINLE
jgi:hypothetical protein